MMKRNAAILAGVTVALSVVAAGAASDDSEGDEEPTEQIVFEDRFDGELDDGWSWLREDEQHWRLRKRDGEPGLEIRVVPGKANTVRNALLREAPDRSEAGYAFEVTVENLTPPEQQWEQAGLTWYHAGEPVTKIVKEFVDGELSIVPGFDPVPNVPVRVRIEVRGDKLRALYRVLEDEAETDAHDVSGGPYVLAGTTDLPPSEPGEDQISIQCYDGPPDAEHWMRFTHFRILRLAD